MRILSLSSVLFSSSMLFAQGEWSAPILETTLNTAAADTGPHLSPDGLTVHWASFSSGNWDLWSATRTSRSAPWSPPVLESALNSIDVELEPFLCADGLTIYFSSQRPGGQGSSDIMRSTRPAIGFPWSPPTFVTEINSTAADAAATLTADELELYMVSSGWGAPFAPNNALFVATRPNRTSPFGPPTLIPALSNPNSHRDLEVSPDGLNLYYTEADASRRVRVYRSTRTNRNQPWPAGVPLPEFDSIGSGVYSFTRTEDGLEAMIAAVFPVSSGSQELMATKFEGLASTGAPTLTQGMTLSLRDSANPGLPYAMALSLGNTGFPLGARFVPIDGDFLFVSTFGVGVPPWSTGFLGALNAEGVGSASLANPLPALVGINLWAAGFTLSNASPFGIRTISNAVALQLQ